MNGDQEITRVSYSFAKLQPVYNEDRILSNYVLNFSLSLAAGSLQACVNTMLIPSQCCTLSCIYDVAF